MILDEEDKKAFAVFMGKIGEDQIELIIEKPKVKKATAPIVAPQFAP